MIRKSSFLLVIALLWFSADILKAQSLNYSVMWKGDSIGIVSAHKYDSADFRIYVINSEVKFWFFGIKTITYDYHTIYRQDTLISAFSKYLRNGVLKMETSVQLIGAEYKILVDGNSRFLSDSNPIERSVTTIYHNEPYLLSKIFSERYGEVLNITSPDPNHYFIEKPDGRQTEYFFENGICSRVVIDNFFTTFTFERSK